MPGGSIVVDDLVNPSTVDGRVLALDRATGAVVWSHWAEGGINGWRWAPAADVESARGRAAAAPTLRR